MLNIEQRFLLKAMEDRNFVCFNYEDKSFKDVKVLKFEDGLIYTDNGNFELEKVMKVVILKDRF